MKKTSKTLLILLWTVLSLVLLGTASSAAEIIDSGICGDNAVWSLDADGNLVIAGTGETYGYEKAYAKTGKMLWIDYATFIKTIYVGEGITDEGELGIDIINVERVDVPATCELPPRAAGASKLTDLYYYTKENRFNPDGEDEYSRTVRERLMWYVEDWTVHDSTKSTYEELTALVAEEAYLYNPIHQSNDDYQTRADAYDEKCSELGIWGPRALYKNSPIFIRLHGYAGSDSEKMVAYINEQSNIKNGTEGIVYITFVPLCEQCETDSVVYESSCRATALCCSVCGGIFSESNTAIIDCGICGDNAVWTVDADGNLVITGTGETYGYEEAYEKTGKMMWIDYSTFIKTIYGGEGITDVGGLGIDIINVERVDIPTTCKKPLLVAGASKLTDVYYYTKETEFNPNGEDDYSRSILERLTWYIEDWTVHDSTKSTYEELTALVAEEAYLYNPLHWQNADYQTRETAYAEKCAALGVSGPRALYKKDTISIRLHGYAGSDSEKMAAYLNEQINGKNNTEDVIYVEFIAICLHTETETVTRNATCLVKGYEAVYCTDCGDLLSYTELPMLPHSYTGNCRNNENGTHSRQCVNGCNTYGNAENCNYSSSASVQPTCTVKGITQYVCTDCGYTYSEQNIECLPHAYGEWTIRKEPTVRDAGEEIRYCTRTGCVAFETRPVDKIPTQTSVDTKTGVSVSYADGTYADGTLSVTVDNENFDGEEYLIPQFAYANCSILNIKTALNGTEVQPGTAVLVSVPLPEGFTKNAVTVWHIRTDTGMREKVSDVRIENGVITFLADSFSIYVFVDESSPVVHLYREVIKSAGCTEDGCVQSVCSICGDIKNESVLPAKGHSSPDVNGCCTRCGEKIAEACSCHCHQGGIAGLIWKIKCLFYRLFSMDEYRVCQCGAVHW